MLEVLNNEHFNQWAALLSTTLKPGWRRNHPTIPVRERLDALAADLTQGSWNAEHVLLGWTQLVSQITLADPNLRSSPEDLAWLETVVRSDSGKARFTLTLLYGSARSNPRLYSIDELVTMTGVSATTWRNRAQQWGVIQAGQRTYLFSEYLLRAHGIKLERSLIIEEE